MTRDSRLLWLGLAIAVVGYLLTASGPPTHWTYMQWLQFASFMLAWVSGKLATSPLAGDVDSGTVSPPTLKAVIDRTSGPAAVVALAVAASLSASCASVPLKQKAVLTVQASQAALGIVDDAEMAAYALQAPGLTADRHRAFSRALSDAYAVQIKLATALQAWRAGEPVPASLDALLADAQQAWDVVTKLEPGVPQTDLIAKMRAWLVELNTLSRALGAAIPPWLATATGGAR
jgi:hypothetical protein